jgi:hypothetical protein
MMEKFEGQYVGYMLNQAGMPFFMVSAYPHYKIEGDRLVVDNGKDSQEFRAQATAGRALIRKIHDRYTRGKRIPRTWVKALQEYKILVMVTEELKVAQKEWCEQYFRTLRWLDTVVA